MIKLQKQSNLNSSLVQAFNKISCHSSFKLIGSARIRNLIYTNDFDLNEYTNYTTLQHFIKTVFDECFKDPLYYILDFKAGIDHNDDGIHWTYAQVKKGSQKINNKTYLLNDCLKQHDSIIKLDLCYILDGLFVDITNNYFINNQTKDIKKSKKDIIMRLKDDIHDLIANKNYFKCFKRLFNLEMITNKVDIDLLNFLNSDYGRVYKAFHDLEMVLIMSHQNFKRLDKKLLLTNLESIKMFLSKVTIFNVDHIIDELNDIIKSKKFDELDELIHKGSILLNNKVESKFNTLYKNF